jgi:hypothetical protein
MPQPPRRAKPVNNKGRDEKYRTVYPPIRQKNDNTKYGGITVSYDVSLTGNQTGPGE